MPPLEQRELLRSRDSSGATGNQTSQLWETTRNPKGHSFTGTRGRMKNKTLIIGNVMVKKEEYSGYTPELEMT